MPVSAYASAIVGSALLTLVILAQSGFWQRKEYRLDRALTAIMRGDEARWPYVLHDAALIGMVAAWLFASRLALDSAQNIGWLFLLGLLLYHGYRIVKRGVVRPDLTNKAILVLVLSVLGVVALGLATARWVAYGALWWSSLVIATPFVVAIFVSLVNVPGALRKRSIIRRAASHRDTLRDLTVIGITGSYGKTSTKYFLEQLLVHAGRRAVATAKHRNAEFPVAQDMLAQVAADTSHYIVEMGAYRRGEITALTCLTRPQVGILTAIGTQHAALFGSVENIALAKWELIEGLADDGMAIVNADDDRVMEMVTRTARHVHTYSLQQAADIWLSDIVYEPTSVTAKLHVKEQVASVEVPVAGEGMLSSVAAASAGAYAAGLTIDEIAAGLTTIEPPAHTMQVVVSPTGALIVDDSYSASEGGVRTAVRHLGRLPQKQKLVVLPPVIELGSESAAVHARIAQELLSIDTRVVIYGQTHINEFRSVVPDTVWNDTWQVEADPHRLAMLLKKHADSDTAILLAGRLPDVVRHAVLP